MPKSQKITNDNVVLEDADIRFRNFEGKEGKFNPAGRRNFCVLLDDDLAADLANNDWNVKYLKPYDEGDKPQAYLQVSVSFDNRPPNIYLISRDGRNRLTEKDINILDWAEFENIDLIIRPYHWEVNGKKGVKAYLATGYFTIVKDEFEDKYMNIPDSSENTIGGCGNCDGCDGSCHE